MKKKIEIQSLRKTKRFFQLQPEKCLSTLKTGVPGTKLKNSQLLDHWYENSHRQEKW